ncbi:MAG: hypothetical protein IPN32_26050 [Deltaproteobacteria bacterium]|nr:hypothetical protein [Deltaproteobacteria bacterium]
MPGWPTPAAQDEACGEHRDLAAPGDRDRVTAATASATATTTAAATVAADARVCGRVTGPGRGLAAGTTGTTGTTIAADTTVATATSGDARRVQLEPAVDHDDRDAAAAGVARRSADATAAATATATAEAAIGGGDRTAAGASVDVVARGCTTATTTAGRAVATFGRERGHPVAIVVELAAGLGLGTRQARRAVFSVLAVATVAWDVATDHAATVTRRYPTARTARGREHVGARHRRHRRTHESVATAAADATARGEATRATLGAGLSRRARERERHVGAREPTGSVAADDVHVLERHLHPAIANQRHRDAALPRRNAIGRHQLERLQPHVGLESATHDRGLDVSAHARDRLVVAAREGVGVAAVDRHAAAQRHGLVVVPLGHQHVVRRPVTGRGHDALVDRTQRSARRAAVIAGDPARGIDEDRRAQRSVDAVVVGIFEREVGTIEALAGPGHAVAVGLATAAALAAATTGAGRAPRVLVAVVTRARRIGVLVQARPLATPSARNGLGYAAARGKEAGGHERSALDGHRMPSFVHHRGRCSVGKSSEWDGDAGSRPRLHHRRGAIDPPTPRSADRPWPAVLGIRPARDVGPARHHARGRARAGLSAARTGVPCWADDASC